MDYRAIGELIWFALLGLSVLVVVTGFSVRVFLAPVVREALERLGDRRSEDQQRLAARLELLESRLSDLESDVHEVKAAEEFHRRLEAPGAERSSSGKESGSGG